MKSSEILRKAARLVEAGQCSFGCVAVDVVTQWNFSEALKACEYIYLFMPVTMDKGGGFWPMRSKSHRIIGLCLAAAIAESEGD